MEEFRMGILEGVVDDRDYTENVVCVHANICCAMLSLCVTIKDISNTGLLVGLSAISAESRYSEYPIFRRSCLRRRVSLIRSDSRLL